MGLKSKLHKWLHIKVVKNNGHRSTEAAETLADMQEAEGFSLNGLTQDKFDLIMKYGKASDQLGKYKSKPLIELPYGVVRKDLPALQQRDMLFDSIMLLLKCQYDKVSLKGVTANEMMSFLLWIKKQQEHIYAIEQTYLSSDPEPEMIASGVHKLNEFGVLTTIHQLSGRDPLKHAAIEAMPYYKVYEILKLEKTEKDIHEAYRKIMETKAKNKNI